MIPRSQTRSAATMAAPRHGVPKNPALTVVIGTDQETSRKKRSRPSYPNSALKNNNSGMPDQFLSGT